MKLRGWLLLVLFAHILAHPLVHGMGTSVVPKAPPSVSSSSGPFDISQNAGDQCELCRVGHNTIVSPRLPKADLLNSRRVRIALQAVNYASLQADLRIPSRAPPSL